MLSEIYFISFSLSIECACLCWFFQFLSCAKRIGLNGLCIEVFQLCSTFLCVYPLKTQPTTNEFQNLLCFSIKYPISANVIWIKFITVFQCSHTVSVLWFGFFFLLYFLTDTKSNFIWSVFTHVALLFFSLSSFGFLRWRRSIFFFLLFSFRFCYLTFLFDSAWSFFMIIFAAHMLSTVKKYALSISILV